MTGSMKVSWMCWGKPCIHRKGNNYDRLWKFKEISALVETSSKSLGYCRRGTFYPPTCQEWNWLWVHRGIRLLVIVEMDKTDLIAVSGVIKHTRLPDILAVETLKHICSCLLTPSNVSEYLVHTTCWVWLGMAKTLWILDMPNLEPFGNFSFYPRRLETAWRSRSAS